MVGDYLYRFFSTTATKTDDIVAGIVYSMSYLSHSKPLRGEERRRCMFANESVTEVHTSPRGTPAAVTSPSVSLHAARFKQPYGHGSTPGSWRNITRPPGLNSPCEKSPCEKYYNYTYTWQRKDSKDGKGCIIVAWRGPVVGGRRTKTLGCFSKRVSRAPTSTHRLSLNTDFHLRTTCSLLF